ncbi:MAG TPA: PEP-utilizing enzyme [Solirubrobacteraceae bacterium]|nr:PEP-utilizing enzyme [Solirubrobacteraceae bacterium]
MILGEGVSVFAARPVSGRAYWFSSPADVLLVDPKTLGETIAFVRMPGVAFLSPILGQLRAVVCTTGSPASHLALVALQYGVPCIMGAELHEDLPDGTAVRLEMRAGRRARITAGAASRPPA